VEQIGIKTQRENCYYNSSWKDWVIYSLAEMRFEMMFPYLTAEHMVEVMLEVGCSWW